MLVNQLEQYIKNNDWVAGMKISSLMEKYNLSLYKVRELRKKYDLKTKWEKII